MKALVAAAFLAIAAFAGTSAHAASLTKTSYPTPQSAALHGAAYKLDKAVGWGEFVASDLKITKTIDGTGTMQKYRVATKATSWDNKPLYTVTTTVRRVAPSQYKAYIPNR